MIYNIFIFRFTIDDSCRSNPVTVISPSTQTIEDVTPSLLQPYNSSAVSSFVQSPISSADILASNSESENILSLIDKTLLYTNPVQSSTTTSSSSHLTFVPIRNPDCMQCRIIDQELNGRPTDVVSGNQLCKQNLELDQKSSIDKNKLIDQEQSKRSQPTSTNSKRSPDHKKPLHQKKITDHKKSPDHKKSRDQKESPENKLVLNNHESPDRKRSPEYKQIINDNINDQKQSNNNTDLTDQSLGTDIVILASQINTERYQLDHTPPRLFQRQDSVWQVADIDQYPPIIQSLGLSPIESVQESSVRSASEIDSTSFIILRDDVDTSKESLLTISTNARSKPPASNSLTKTTTTAETTKQSSPNSRERCNDCCFCNPDLHRRSVGTASANSCSYCQRRRSVNSPPQPKSQETRSTNTTHFYETLSKTDHTHVRTKSKDSDTVSLKCTKTNSKVRRFIPEDALNGNSIFDENMSAAAVPQENSNESTAAKKELAVPRKPPKIPPAVLSPSKRTTNANAKAQKSERNQKTGGVRLPSPFVSSSQSYDSASSSSQCSSTSSGSSSPSKKCPVLPVAKWQNQSSRTAPPPVTTKARASRYQDFYGNKTTNTEQTKMDVVNKVISDAEMTTTQQSSGKLIF